MGDPPANRASRRRYLGALGSGLLTVGAGCSGAPSDDGSASTTDRTPTGTETQTESGVEVVPEALSQRFSRVIDVAALGADTNGETSVKSLLESNLADDTLFFFPAGTYRIDGLLVIQHRSNVGFYGPDATLRPAPAQQGSWIYVDDVSDLWFEGFTVDNGAPNTGVQIAASVTGGTNEIRDIDVVGFQDVDARTHAFTVQVNGSATELSLRNVRMADGAANGTAVFVHSAPDPGTLRFENCIIEDWYEQGLYGSPHGGPMFVVGGRYANNGKAQVRVGGGNADTQAVVRNVTVRYDDPDPVDIKGNTRGIWLKEGENSLVENCDIYISNIGPQGSSGAIVIGPENGRTTIRNTRITVDARTFAVAAVRPKTEDIFTPSLDHPPQNWDVRLEDVEITGTAEDGTGVWIADRPGSMLSNLRIDQSGPERNGISIVHSPGLTIRGLTCSTPNYPLLVEFGGDSQPCAVRLMEIASLAGTRLSPGSKLIEASPDGFCLSSTLASQVDSSVLGVTNMDPDGLRVSALPAEAIDPF